MSIMDDMNFANVFIHTITAAWLEDNNVQLDVLRLDLVHPIVSGNKFFKLKYYLKDAAEKKFDAIVTSGGAYSNHIVATAFACKQTGFKCTGIIRGEESKQLSHTLLTAKELGMNLHFISRTEYRNINSYKKNIQNAYYINEGGFGTKGADGAAEITKLIKNFNNYTTIVCAVGTGTTFAGIIKLSSYNQIVTGISVMKNNFSLLQNMRLLLNKEDEKKQFNIINNYHFGGYAKYNTELLSFMNEIWLKHNLPTDFVYTAKAFFSIKDLIIQRKISANSHVIMIHTGGMQGNLSLPKGALKF